MSDRKLGSDESDPIETARQVHTLAQRLLQHVSAEDRGDAGAQTDTTSESMGDDPIVTYWYP